MIDPTDGSVLWEKNSRARRAIASTTKILTALVVIENAAPDEVVTASAQAEAVGADDPLVTELDLVAGEKLTVEQLLYGMLLPSASDAAVALAEYVGGSVPEFAKLMNRRARSLGALDSNFTNPAGLDDPAAYSTAYDLAQITRAALRNARFRKIVSTARYQIPWPGRPAPRELINRNLLLGRFQGADGVKTGNTQMAGKSLVASALRGTERRVSVLLGSPEPFTESASLLSFGFSGFTRYFITRAGQPWGQATYGDGTTMKLVGVKDASLLLGEGKPPPPVRYRPSGSFLKVSGSTGTHVPIRAVCPRRPCRPPEKPAPQPLAGLLFLFSPLLSAFR